MHFNKKCDLRSKDQELVSKKNPHATERDVRNKTLFSTVVQVTGPNLILFIYL